MRYEDTNRRNTDTAGEERAITENKEIFSKEEVAAARNMEIRAALAMRGFPLSRSGGEMHCVYRGRNR